MHIVVPVKSVHDPNISPALLSIGADGRSLETPAGMPSVMNGYDANAVEAAIRLKEAGGGSVTVVSVGSEDAVTHLRRAIAMGADRAILIDGPTGLAADGFAVASLLAGAIRDLPAVDLVLCGRQASDTDAGQVPAMLAEHLGMASVGPVRAIVAGDAASLVVDRIGEDRTERLKVRLPAVLALSNEINKPRAPGLKGVMAAKRPRLSVSRRKRCRRRCG